MMGWDGEVGGELSIYKEWLFEAKSWRNSHRSPAPHYRTNMFTGLDWCLSWGYTAPKLCNWRMFYSAPDQPSRKADLAIYNCFVCVKKVTFVAVVSINKSNFNSCVDLISLPRPGHNFVCIAMCPLVMTPDSFKLPMMSLYAHNNDR